jgi:hypothetical protein
MVKQNEMDGIKAKLEEVSVERSIWTIFGATKAQKRLKRGETIHTWLLCRRQGGGRGSSFFGRKCVEPPLILTLFDL